MEAILARRSIRKYQETMVGDEIIEQLLRAAMAAPSAANEQPWEFIILKDQSIMKKITEVHPYAKMLADTPVAIVVCGDQSKELLPGCWMLDCSAAAENILLEVADQGLGAVWLGVYPFTERMESIKKILNLPAAVIPLAIIPVGYPAEQKEPEDRFQKERIHYDRW